MITHDEIESLGFEKVDEWSTDVTDAYVYRVNRYDKPKNTQNIYRLDRLINTDYMELVSSLENEMYFQMRTYSFNGELENIDDLFELFEQFKEANRKI